MVCVLFAAANASALISGKPGMHHWPTWRHGTESSSHTHTCSDGRTCAGKAVHGRHGHAAGDIIHFTDYVIGE